MKPTITGSSKCHKPFVNSAGEGGPSKNTHAATQWVGVGELWGCVGRATLHLPLDMTTQAPQQFCPYMGFLLASPL